MKEIAAGKRDLDVRTKLDSVDAENPKSARFLGWTSLR